MSAKLIRNKPSLHHFDPFLSNKKGIKLTKTITFFFSVKIEHVDIKYSKLNIKHKNGFANHQQIQKGRQMHNRIKGSLLKSIFGFWK